MQHATKTTPMMQQYLDIKAQYQDVLLFYRMGDFYELFFEDAEIAAKALNITLTRRGQHKGNDIPMCGVPFHAYEAYLSKLVKKGFRVAICEQMEKPNPQKRGVIRRDVVRLITPGTLVEENLLEGKNHNFLVGVLPLDPQLQQLAIAAIDISTGAFYVEKGPLTNVCATLQGWDPQEMLFPNDLLNSQKARTFLKTWEAKWHPLPRSKFHPISGHKRLCNTFNVATLKGFGDFDHTIISVAGALVDYIHITQKGRLPRLDPPQQENRLNYLHMDSATLRNLEIFKDVTGQCHNSLRQMIDHTLTPQGGRLLTQHLMRPLRALPEIKERQAMVRFFLDEKNAYEMMRTLLPQAPDAERALSRISLGHESPRDLGAIRDLLHISQACVQSLSNYLHLPSLGVVLLDQMRLNGVLKKTLDAACVKDLPPHTREGMFIQTGFDHELDALRQVNTHAQEMLDTLQETYRQETDIPSLKIKHNNIIGYHVEVTQTHAKKLTTRFIHRQTTVSAMRFSTEDLSLLASKILNAQEASLAKEVEIFQDLCRQAMGASKRLICCTRAVALLDVCASHSTAALEKNYVCPHMVSDPKFHIENARHPIVERGLKEEGKAFTPNSCTLLNTPYMWLLTGPNMGGKSTFLRQNALCVILAQIGAFVPATSATIGIVDRLFSRVGASDNLFQGQSTFMVEMVETAVILNQATPQSFVILDEVGRGTSTYDGVSIAWATAEHLHDQIKCRCLFATHYHELADLESTHEHLSCHTMRVKEWEGDIVLLHQVIPGASDQSYGIHVAKLAGLPASVLQRATKILSRLKSTRT